MKQKETKWKIYKWTVSTVCAALLKDGLIGCKNAVLRKLLLKTFTINCLAYEEKTRRSYDDNLCLFRALALNF